MSEIESEPITRHPLTEEYSPIPKEIANIIIPFETPDVTSISRSKNIYLWLGLGFLFLLALGKKEKRTNNLAGLSEYYPRKAKNKKIFWIAQDKEGNVYHIFQNKLDSLKQHVTQRKGTGMSLYATWAYNIADAVKNVRTGIAERYNPNNLSGAVSTCSTWVGGKCFMYAPTCRSKKTCAVDPKLSGIEGLIRTCIKFRKIKDKHNRKISRCAKFAPTCNSPVECAYPPGKKKATGKEIKDAARMLADEANEKLEDSRRVYRTIIAHGGLLHHRRGTTKQYEDIPKKYFRSTGLPVDEIASEIGFDSADELYRAIKSEENALRGMPKRFNWKHFADEAHSMLLSQKSKGLQGLSRNVSRGTFSGLPLGILETSEYKTYKTTPGGQMTLFGGIIKQYRNYGDYDIISENTRIDGKKHTSFSYKKTNEKLWNQFYVMPGYNQDIDNELPHMVAIIEKIESLTPKRTKKEYKTSPGGQMTLFGGAESFLFNMPRPDLVMRIDDAAESDDPLIGCMERQGWNSKRIAKIQESIADKMTPDMFGKMQRLTGGEAMYQEQIQGCLDRIKAGYTTKKQMTLFGNLAELEFAKDANNNITKVIGWQNKKPVVIYPGKSGGVYPSTAPAHLHGEPYEYILDQYKIMGDKDWKKPRPGGGPKAMDLRRWYHEYFDQKKEFVEKKPKWSRDIIKKLYKTMPGGQMTLFGKLKGIYNAHA